MQNIISKLVTILVVLALCILAIKFKELRLGKDLRGGVSLIYNVQLDEDVQDPTEVVNQTIAVLKDRVNPAGVLDISMQPLGRDRIEIVMPLPNDEVRALSKAYRAKRDVLLERSEIPSNALDDALRRGVAAAELGGDMESERGRKMVELQAAYDAQTAARDAFNAAEAAGQSEAELIEAGLASAVADAELEFEAMYQDVLGLSLGESRVRRVLALPTIPQKIKNADGTWQKDEDGKQVMGPSQRAGALEALRSEFPHIAADLDDTVEAFDAYQSKRKGFDDPEDLIRLLRGAGVLEFYIAVTAGQPEGIDVDELRTQLKEFGPENVNVPGARWYPINELKQWYENKEELAALEADPVGYFARARGVEAEVYEGEYYLLIYTRSGKSMTHDGDTNWSITQAFPGADSLGRPAVNFTLDAAGGGLMGRLTGAHVNQPMAIVLDGEVYSAPSIRSTITTNGQITGNYSEDEVAYLIRVLAAGSLQARLSPDPIAMNTLGPSIGADNLERGRKAFIAALIVVAVFMIFYYFFAGIVAVLALMANGVIIFGAMMAIDGTFTLPGLAGIVLTIGMAVDANVLIYERIREEMFAGEEDLRGAIRQGYRKALSTILDANITNLIVCLVLFKTATTEVKGFALTLTIGICATLFTALFVTRQIYYLYTDLFKVRKLPMLPTVIPAIHRALEPSINWIGLRRVFWVVSAILVVGSIALVANRGVDMFDTEFRGGVSLTMQTAPVAGATGDEDTVERIQLKQSGGPDSVEERVKAIAERALASAGDGDPDTRTRVLAELANATVLTSGETSVDPEGRITGDEFQIKVASPKGLEDEDTIASDIVAAIVAEFGDQLDVTQPLAFDGSNDADSSSYTFPITKPELGQNIGRSGATQRIPTYLGGVAIVLENVTPPTTPEDLVRRIDRMRNQPDYAVYGARKVAAYGLTPATGTDGFSDLAVVVFDPYRSFQKVDTEVWYQDVADVEWKLVGVALTRPPSLKQVDVFSSAVADTLSAQAIVAVALTLLGILVYIWVRFGSLRYSVAAIAALMHDVTIALGLLAVSTIIGGTVLGATLLVEPFRIDLGVVAALLTIIGYSLNDTIVILDRIRENRGKLPLPTAKIVNNSINQTVSRTLLTSVTTLLAVGIMYVAGGSGIRSFTFCLLVGLIFGTYSSVAIAAPLVFRREDKVSSSTSTSTGAVERGATAA